jgi:hypothetical protein
VVLPEPDYVNITTAMENQCVKFNLQPHPYFFEKTIQLYEAGRLLRTSTRPSFNRRTEHEYARLHEHSPGR